MTSTVALCEVANENRSNNRGEVQSEERYSPSKFCGNDQTGVKLEVRILFPQQQERLVIHEIKPMLSTVDLLAQLAEQYTFNVWVPGSNPGGVTLHPCKTSTNW